MKMGGPVSGGGPLGPWGKARRVGARTGMRRPDWRGKATNCGVSSSGAITSTRVGGTSSSAPTSSQHGAVVSEGPSMVSA
jgi:hypothetical protein